MKAWPPWSSWSSPGKNLRIPPKISLGFSKLLGYSVQYMSSSQLQRNQTPTAQMVTVLTLVYIPSPRLQRRAETSFRSCQQNQPQSQTVTFQTPACRPYESLWSHSIWPRKTCSGHGRRTVGSGKESAPQIKF